MKLSGPAYDMMWFILNCQTVCAHVMLTSLTCAESACPRATLSAVTTAQVHNATAKVFQRVRDNAKLEESKPDAPPLQSSKAVGPAPAGLTL